MAALISPRDYANLAAIAGDRRFAYGTQADQFGELFVPPGRRSVDPLPVVVLLHGGCWREQFGCTPLGQMARAIADGGVAVWNLEYRRLGGAGGWPMTFEDAAAGLDFLRQIAAPENLDLTRVVAVGHSAGGHLALWLAGRGRISPTAYLYCTAPLPLRAVVSLAGIGDLGHSLEMGICRGAPAQLMGGTPVDHPDRYAQGSPHALLPLGLPHWHVCGAADPLVPAAHVEHFVALATASGDEPVLELIDGVGHFEIVIATSPVWPQVETVIRTALGRSRD